MFLLFKALICLFGPSYAFAFLRFSMDFTRWMFVTCQRLERLQQSSMYTFEQHMQMMNYAVAAHKTLNNAKCNFLYWWEVCVKAVYMSEQQKCAHTGARRDRRYAVRWQTLRRFLMPWATLLISSCLRKCPRFPPSCSCAATSTWHASLQLRAWEQEWWPRVKVKNWPRRISSKKSNGGSPVDELFN